MNIKDIDPYGEENWNDEIPINKEKEPDYKGIVEHLEEWSKLGIPHSMNDLRELEKRYGIPPTNYKNVIRYI